MIKKKKKKIGMIHFILDDSSICAQFVTTYA